MIRIWSVLVSLAMAIGTPALAYCHFVLISPPSASEQSSLGDPQKSAPCGQADPGLPAVPTNQVTTFQEGSTITIEIDETIFHPGHYRVAIAQDPESLPPDPVVTPGDTDCGSTVIEENPTLPLLGDGLLVHDTKFGKQQTVQVQLPAGFTCDQCTLQVIEFMSDHGLNNPGGCFYHHCATVSVVSSSGISDAGTSTDATLGSDASSGSTDSSSGCGCDLSSRPSLFNILLMAMVLGILAVPGFGRRL